MLEYELLTNYGVLGLWTVTLLYREYVRDRKETLRDQVMMKLIKRNTEVIARINTTINKCKRTR